ncbi:MAG: cupin domain-containing protein [Actinobacteria bacterium]|nr:cupin domain-containing protein [Actinomycetota bacterium]
MAKIKGRRFVSIDDVETQVFPWGKLQWLSEPRVTETNNMTAGIVTLNLGKGHQRHNHEGCEEILYVIEGEGDQTIEVNNKLEKKKVKRGDLIHIPAGAYHGTINTGKKPMVIFAVYQYAGPEVYLRNLPECVIEPPKKLKK